MNTWIRSANLHRWINRPGCPAALRDFYRLFTLHLGINLGDRNPPVKSRTKTVEHRPAHYQYKRVNYSRATTHLGNSLILYLAASGRTWAGSIKEIIVNASGKGEVRFNVQHQAPLPKGKKDPFKAFPHFPAATYSSKMSDTVISIDPNFIISHCARYNFSKDRAVILNLSRSLVGLVPPPPRSTSARRSSTSPIIALVVPPPSALDLQPDLRPSFLFAAAFECEVDTSRHL
ncbi:hypothetical protein B0H10DRAFT_2211135 [Mycena sp. CBHHK59/15]|nr:hypothetical protein B0H10DRAFT_2211135 [Mycena sp. CBHHK59/15]